MNPLTIAWRNLWRNRRRTLITTASVFFGVLLAVMMSSMQEGSYSNMIDNIVKFYSGYIQVHHEDYWENKTIDNAAQPTPELLKQIEDVNGVNFLTPRFESFALASSEQVTQPVMIIGIEPDTEEKLTRLSRWVRSGSFLADQDDGILLTSELARHLGMASGDTLALLSQGYFGNTVAAKFPVRGIIALPSPEMNKQFAYLSLPTAQNFYSAEGMITSLTVMVSDYSQVKPALKELNQVLSPPWSAMSWDQMQPEMLQMIESDRAGGIVMVGILYMIIAFGILGTLMMMMAERKKELGVMVAVGMQKTRLAIILFWETFYIGMIGTLAGLLVSIPIIATMMNNPIPLTGDAAQVMIDMGIEPLVFFSGMPKIFVNQVLIVFSFTLVLSLYPVIGALRLKIIRALRS